MEKRKAGVFIQRKNEYFSRCQSLVSVPSVKISICLAIFNEFFSDSWKYATVRYLSDIDQFCCEKKIHREARKKLLTYPTVCHAVGQ